MRDLRVTQVALFIRVEIQVHGIHRHHRGEQGAAIDPAGDQIPARHFRAADPPINRAGDPREVQIERRGFEGSLGSPQVGFGLRNRALALIQLLLGDGAAVLQPLHAGQFDARELERGLVALDVGGGAIVFRLVGPRIDDEQEVAALDLAAFGERQLVDVARNTRADFHRLHGLQPSGELIPILDALLENLGHADLRRRGLGAAA